MLFESNKVFIYLELDQRCLSKCVQFSKGFGCSNFTLSFKEDTEIFGNEVQCKLDLQKGNLILYQDDIILMDLHKNNNISDSLNA